VAYRWNESAIAAQQFQAYRRSPRRLMGIPPATFTGASSLLNGSTGGGAMLVSGEGSVAFDFDSECAGWLEFQSPDLAPLLASGALIVLMSTSEFTQPQFTTPTKDNNNGNCTSTVSSLDGGRYRLDLNSELYEGLRYGWLHVRRGKDCPASFRITVSEFTAVCQVLPINYADNAFVASGSTPSALITEPGAGAWTLEEVWYTAIYTMRVDLLPGGFGSILMDRCVYPAIVVEQLRSGA